MERLVFTVPPERAGQRLGSYLRHEAISVSLLRSVKYIEDGLVVDGVRAKTDLALAAGACVEVALPEDATPAVAPEEMGLAVLHRSAHAMVVDKPAGLVVHPTRSHVAGTMAAGFEALMQAEGQRRAFRPVGRLDGDTSGVMLLAMNAYATPLLAKSMQKSYLALVEGVLHGEGEIDAPLGPADDSVIRQCVRADGKAARTRWQALGSKGGTTLVAVWPVTGRTHQIRAHFSYAGYPLVGDGLYGGGTGALARHGLHCASIEYREPPALVKGWEEGPYGEKITLKSPLPRDMQAAMAALGWTNDSLDGIIPSAKVKPVRE